MELGKRKTRVEAYIDSLMESPEKKQKKAEFEQSLRQFYKRKWNAPLKPPMVHGLEFDLHKLYDVVLAFGGWQKVSQMEKWADVAEQFGVKDDILGGDNAIKILYMRYLSKFEQNETVGDVDDMMDPEMMRSRNRQQSFLATSECPVYISRPTPQELHRLASSDADYSRLTKSLISGLPNEVDFAMNVCTLLSHPGPRLLKVGNAPHLIDLLLAHIGIFDPEDTSAVELYESWREKSGRDFFLFWAASGICKDYLQLLLPLAVPKYKAGDEDLFVGVGPSFNSSDPISWRVYQIATILRNLSFEPVNKVQLAESWALIKFCVLACNCKWNQLSTAALDTLSNIASDLDLSHSRLLYQSGHSILHTIHTGITSDDKFKLIRSMEILAGLCGGEENESILCQFLDVPILERMFSYLVVKDIMLCVYTLECIYQISEMGSIACEMLSELRHSISLLLSLASVEAVSFGPSGLAGMKVVEYHPPGTLPPQLPQHPAQLPPQIMQPPPPNYHPQQPTSAFHQLQMSGGTPHNDVVNEMTPPSQQPHHPPPPVNNPSRPTPKYLARHEEPLPIKIGESKVEQLSAQWIRTSCEYDPRAATSRGDLYAAYVDDLRNIHHSLSCSLQQFTNMVKLIFPEVSFRLPEGGPIMLAYGLKMNKPHMLATSGTSGATPAPQASPTVSSHPVMKAILEKKENGVEEKIKEEKNTRQVCTSSPVEAAQLMGDSVAHEAKIVRVENRGRENEEVGGRRKKSEENDEEEMKEKEEGNEGEEEEEVIDGLVETTKQNGEKNEKSNGRGEGDKEGGGENTDTSEKRDEVVPARDPFLPPRPLVPPEMMCEWDGCGLLFESSSSLLHHASIDHVEEGSPAVCRWPSCDATLRSKWSLVTHLQDHHAGEMHLREAARRRREGRSPSKPPPYCPDIPRDLPQHPGYSKNAAIDAIRRHAFNFIPKDFTEEVEGPVTKSIRLTACLILRNIARYSIEGRMQLRRHERILSWMALSRLESNSALAQLLAELPQHEEVEVESEEGESSAPASVPSLFRE